MKLFGFGRPYINVDHQSVESSELSGLGTFFNCVLMDVHSVLFSA